MAIGQYDYEGLCKAYINQTHIKGTTAQNRMSFYVTGLYSYDSLMAELDDVNKVLLINLSIAHYSKTSKRQLQILTNVASNYTIFQIDLDLTPSQNLIKYVERLHILLAQYTRARKFKYIRKLRIIRTYEEAQAYINYIQIDKRTKPYKQFKQFFNTMFEAKIL